MPSNVFDWGAADLLERGRQWRVKDHEWLLDVSPASGGEIRLPGLAVGCVVSVRTAVAARRHCASARTRRLVSAGLVTASVGFTSMILLTMQRTLRT